MGSTESAKVVCVAPQSDLGFLPAWHYCSSTYSIPCHSHTASSLSHHTRTSQSLTLPLPHPPFPGSAYFVPRTSYLITLASSCRKAIAHHEAHIFLGTAVDVSGNTLLSSSIMAGRRL